MMEWECCSDLGVLPDGNLGISQKICTMSPIVSSRIEPEGGKWTVDYYVSKNVGLQMASYL